jgi:hypothetical protein
MEVQDMFEALYSVSFSAITIANNSNFVPDIGLFIKAAATLFSILDSEDEEQIRGYQ